MRIGIYGRPACAALVVAAAVAAAAGATAAWRDPKVHNPGDTAKEPFDAVIIDPAAPNAAATADVFAGLEDRTVHVFTTDDLDAFAAFLGTTVDAVKPAEGTAADDEGSKAGNEGDKTPPPPPADKLVTELPFKVLQKLAKQHEVEGRSTAAIVDGLAAKGITSITAEALASLTSE